MYNGNIMEHLDIPHGPNMASVLSVGTSTSYRFRVSSLGGQTTNHAEPPHALLSYHTNASSAYSTAV